MTDQVEINKAIGAHGLWKQRLREAIETGRSDFTPERVQDSRICEFGKWLAMLPATEQQTTRWQNVAVLHMRFHNAAAGILALALKGAKQEAENEIAYGSKFGNISATLIAALMEWKTELKGAGSTLGASVTAGPDRRQKFGIQVKLATYFLLVCVLPAIGVTLYAMLAPASWISMSVFSLFVALVSAAVMFPAGFRAGRNIATPIAKLTTKATRIAEGDFGHSEFIKAEGEIADLVRAIEVMGEILASIVHETQTVAVQMTTASEALANSSEEVASSSQNVASTQQQITKGAQTQATMVVDAQQQIQSLGEGIKNVRANADSINEVVDLITSIASQTNLLALNAAIEAARAGAAGRGFSVVADQVRKLADESKQAVKRTESMVAQIVAVSATQLKATAEVIGAVDSIATVAEETSASTEEASAAAEEQASAMEEITSTAQSLAKLAEKLGKVIGTFDLGQGVVSKPVQEKDTEKPVASAPRGPVLAISETGKESQPSAKKSSRPEPEFTNPDPGPVFTRVPAAEGRETHSF